MIIDPRAPSQEWEKEGMTIVSWLSIGICPGSDLSGAAGEERIIELKYDEIMLKTIIIRDEMISLQLAGRKPC